MLKNLKGYLLVFISAILYGSYGVWSVLLGSGFGTFYQGWIRALLVLLIIVPIVIFTKKWKPLSLADLKKFGWSLSFLLFSQAPIYYAFQNAGIGITSLIFFGSYVAAAYIVGAILLKEKMDMTKIISFILAIIGLYLTFSGSLGKFSILALSMAVIAGISGGGGMSATKLIPKKYSSIQVLVVTWLQSLVIHLPISILIGEQQLTPSFNMQWFALIGFALAGVLSSWFLVEGLKTIDASIGGLISLLEVVIAILFGYIIFNEQIFITTVFGAIFVIIAAALPQIISIVKPVSKINANSNI